MCVWGEFRAMAVTVTVEDPIERKWSQYKQGPLSLSDHAATGELGSGLTSVALHAV